MCVWVCRCAYVMVCELDENRLLAGMVLTNITRLIREHVTSHEQKNAEASRTEHISNSIQIRFKFNLLYRYCSRLRRQLPFFTTSCRVDSWCS